jgi:hypothetical protein
MISAEQDDPRLDELLNRWEELQEAGQVPQVEELCRTSPELAEELRRRVALLQDWSRFASLATNDWEPVSINTTAVPPCDELRARVSRYAESGTAYRSILEEGDRYTIVGTLGTGGMGEVLLAQDRDLRREVAIKTAKDWRNGDRFIREAQLTAQLNHPNILPVFDFGTIYDSEISITLPRLKGNTLKDVLVELKTAHERLEQLPSLIDALLKVCDAIEYAHYRGVIHHDIKPSNVLVGDFGEVYLIDWGLAVELDGDNISRGSGTPAYMAPEMFSDSVKKDVRIDIFGLGGILYEILFDRTPNSVETVRAIRDRRVVAENGRQRDFTAKNWPVPEALVRVCRKALEDNPEARFSSAREMSIAIQEARIDHMRGTSLRVIIGLTVGLVTLTLSTVGLIATLTGYLSIHWSFWAAFMSCSLGLSIATIIEATGRNMPLLRREGHKLGHNRPHSSRANENLECHGSATT